MAWITFKHNDDWLEYAGLKLPISDGCSLCDNKEVEAAIVIWDEVEGEQRTMLACPDCLKGLDSQVANKDAELSASLGDGEIPF
jgi:hypothetical protein